MPTSRKADYSGRTFAVPMGLILGLIVFYWVLVDWHALPRLFSLAFASFG